MNTNTNPNPTANTNTNPNPNTTSNSKKRDRANSTGTGDAPPHAEEWLKNAKRRRPTDRSLPSLSLPPYISSPSTSSSRSSPTYHRLLSSTNNLQSLKRGYGRLQEVENGMDRRIGRKRVEVGEWLGGGINGVGGGGGKDPPSSPTTSVIPPHRSTPQKLRITISHIPTDQPWQVDLDRFDENEQDQEEEDDESGRESETEEEGDDEEGKGKDKQDVEMTSAAAVAEAGEDGKKSQSKSPAPFEKEAGGDKEGGGGEETIESKENEKEKDVEKDKDKENREKDKNKAEGGKGGEGEEGKITSEEEKGNETSQAQEDKQKEDKVDDKDNDEKMDQDNPNPLSNSNSASNTNPNSKSKGKKPSKSKSKGKLKGKAKEGKPKPPRVNFQKGDGIPGFDLIIDAGLLDDDNDDNKGYENENSGNRNSLEPSKILQTPPSKTPFTSLFNRIKIQLRNLDPTNSNSTNASSNIIDWQPPSQPSSSPPIKGLKIHRPLSLPAPTPSPNPTSQTSHSQSTPQHPPPTALISLHPLHSPPRFQILPPLSEMIDMREAGRWEVVEAVWRWVRREGGAGGGGGGGDEKWVRCTGGLKVICNNQDRIPYHHLPEYVNRWLRPVEPVVIEYPIIVDQTYSTLPLSSKKRSYDLTIYTDHPLKPHYEHVRDLLAPSNEKVKEVMGLDEKISRLNPLIRNCKSRRDFFAYFSIDPKNFIETWLYTQSKDLDLLLGNERGFGFGLGVAGTTTAGIGNDSRVGSGRDDLLGPNNEKDLNREGEEWTLRRDLLKRKEMFMGDWVEEAILVRDLREQTRLNFEAQHHAQQQQHGGGGQHGGGR